MFSHIFVGVNDFDKAFEFYTALFNVLGVELRFCERDRPWAGWQSCPEPRPLFLIGKPYNQQAAQSGNGQMVAFSAATRSKVDEVYATALAHGGKCDGVPGLRPEYHANYYGAYFFDTEGNKICVACHEAE